MPDLPCFQVDAFTDRLFGGNPAAVCPLDAWLPDRTMQSIANENALAETAFFVRRPDGDYDLRWFTPEIEVDLCGHATLASAFVLLTRLTPDAARVRFHTRSGPLDVARHGGAYAMDLPARNAEPAAELGAALEAALGKKARETLRARDAVAVFETSEEVLGLRPDFAKIAALDAFAVVATARGTGAHADVDFVSRFFAPRAGIPEDPVTGSAHATLAPYWAERLGRTTLRARQVSRRVGELVCELRAAEGRVRLVGNAVLVKTETILFGG